MQTLVDLGELPRLVRDFVSYKLTVQGRSKKTADEYALDLRTFFRYLKVTRAGGDVSALSPEEFSEVDISGLELDFIGSVTPDEIYGFLYYTLSARGNQWSARARKLSAIKSFYKYLSVGKKLIPDNPAEVSLARRERAAARRGTRRQREPDARPRLLHDHAVSELRDASIRALLDKLIRH